MKKLITALTVLTTALFFSSCSHNATEKELAKKVSMEADIKTQNDLNLETNEILENAKGINEKQRQELISLREVTRKKSQEYSTEVLRLRSVLVKDLMATKYDRAEVSLIKKKILTAEKNKASTLLNAFEKANTILGRQVPNCEHILRDFGHAEI